MKKITFTVLLITMSVVALSQKTATSVQQVWVAYFNQLRLSDKLGIWGDFHLRTKENFVTDFSQGIARLGITYYVKDNTKLTAGYAYVNIFPAAGHQNISQPEHRPWQQIQWHTNYPRLRMAQYLRLEERFRRKIKDDDELVPGYNFNYRTRYNLLLMTPLGSKAFAPNTLSFVVNDEVHTNFGKQVVYNTFDQNRFFLGLVYHTNKHDNIQLGYMNVFQQLPAGNVYRSIHAIRLFYFQNLDLRKKDDPNKQFININK